MAAAFTHVLRIYSLFAREWDLLKQAEAVSGKVNCIT